MAAPDGDGTTAVVNLVNGGSGYETTDTITGSGSTTARTTTGANFATGRLYAGSGAARVANVTGIDLSIGAMDEDVTYLGRRNGSESRSEERDQYNPYPQKTRYVVGCHI